MNGTLQCTPKCKGSANSSENPNGDAPPSKRAMKRQQILQEHGSIGALDAPKGKTKVGENGLEWWDGEDQIWRPAAPHNDYREEFIMEDSMLGSYDIQPDHGDNKDDITSFASTYGQQHWNLKDRSTWGNIQDSEGNQVLYLLEKPIRSKEPESSGYMMHNGLVMLDPDDNPVKNWPGIPRCFSSKIEGGRVESLRRICGMTIPDFRARMPRNIKMKSGTVKPLYGLTSINQKLSRFREKNDCPAWLAREKVDSLKKHTLQRLATYGAPPVSTAGLPPPSEYEIERRRLEGRGKNPEKAAGRSVSAEVRKARDEQHMKRFHRLEAEEQARNHLPTVQSPVYQPMQNNYGYAEPISDLTGSLKRKYDEEIQDVLDNQLMEPAQKRSRVASPPRTSPDVDFGIGDDLRFAVPRNFVERWSVKAALLPTAIDFLLYHGEGPPSIAEDRSYNAQYQEIQSIHQSRWSHSTEAPQLVGIGQWLWSFDQVPMPILTEETAGSLLGHTSGEAIVSGPQNIVTNVRDLTPDSEEPHWKGNGVEYPGNQLMASGNEISGVTQDHSHVSADEKKLRHEDPEMVEQPSTLTDEQLLDMFDFNNFDGSAWDPSVFPTTGELGDECDLPYSSTNC